MSVHHIKSAQLVIIEDPSLSNMIKQIPYVQIGNEDTIEPPDYYYGDNMEEAAEAKKGIITAIENPDIPGFRIEAELYLTKKYTFLRKDGQVPLFPDISFIIQGLDTDATLTTCASVFIYGYLVISTWNTYGNLKQITKHVKDCNIYNNQNIFFQIHTTLLGLQRVATRKVIKIRSDEIFTNLLPFIMRMYEFPEKLITTNLFIRRNSQFPYHCSDYIIGGSKKNIFEMFNHANLLVHNREDTKLPKTFRFHCWVPEQILTIGYLLSFYPLYYIFETDHSTLMNLHFDSIDLHSLCPLNLVFTRWDNDENGVLRSRKVNITPANLHEHQNRIIDLYSYKSLFLA